MSKKTFRRQMMQIGIMIVILSLALLVVIFITMRQWLNEDVMNHNESMVSSVSHQVEATIHIPLQLVGQMDMLIGRGYDIAGKELTDYMETILASHKYFDEIIIISQSGELVNIAPYNQGKIGHSMVSQPFYSSDLPRGESDFIQWSNIFFSTTSNRPTISATLHKGDYLIVVTMNLGELPINLIGMNHFAEIKSVSILDQYGTYIMDSDMDKVLQRENHPLFSVTNKRQRIEKGDSVILFNTIDSMNWSIVTEFDMTQIYGNINRILALSLGIWLAFVVVIVLIVNRYLLKVDNNIGELQKRTYQIIHSNYKVEPYEFDFLEFERFAYDFEVMNEEIRTREEEIKGFNQALEMKVLSRTVEIQDANAQMEEEIQERMLVEDELKKLNDHLDTLVKDQTKELIVTNRQLEKNIVLAEEANHAKSQFLAVMSHEMRTPLNGIIGFLEMLNISKIDQGNRELLDIVRHSSNILLNLVNDVLDVSKYEADSGSFESIDLSLYQVISQSIEPYKKLAVQQGLEFNVNFDMDNEVWVKGDRVKIAQIFSNILSNALKFTKVGFINVHCDLLEDQRGYHMYVVIEDSGIGIKENVGKQLFTPFTQADESISREFGGTGLGLTICNNIVNHYNGHLTYESDYGVGTSFSFDIYLEKGQVVNLVEVETSNDSRHNPSSRLLIVEDNEVNRKLLIKFLQRYKKECDIAVNGQEAVEMAKKKAYDMIFMDCQMPVMNGLDATKAIREFDERVKIYAMTAYASKEDCQRCIDVGMDDFYTKPIDLSEIAQIVNVGEAYEADQTKSGDEFVKSDAKESYVRNLEQKLGFDYETCEDLIKTYVSQAVDILDEIGELHQAEDDEGVGHRLHQLKGASGAVRLESISKKVEKAEMLWKLGHKEGCMDLIEGLKKNPLFSQ